MKTKCPPLTPLERRIKQLYTQYYSKQKLIYFRVNSQHFQIAYESPTAAEADWMRSMLAKALARIVVEQSS